MKRRHFLKLVGFLGAFFCFLGFPKIPGFVGCTSKSESKKKKGNSMPKKEIGRVMVLGIDGIDPKILSALMEKKKLPNFRKLKSMGSFLPLNTTNPPQSPVAWSSIATGCNPAGHNIFDFIIRNPKNYLPDLSLLKMDRDNPMSNFRGGRYIPPREGKAFWEITDSEGIPGTVVRWPVTFPPRKGSSHVLAGLGVPDIKGGLGRGAFYTTDIARLNNEDHIILVNLEDGKLKTTIFGPFKQKLKGRAAGKIPLEIVVANHNSVRIKVQKTTFALKKGDWSNWIRLTFDVGLFRKVSAICRFYLVDTDPDLGLYLSPLQIDPENPAFPISNPENYAKELSRNIGLYHTLGLPEDTKALTDGFIDEDAFLSMCDNIMVDREKMLEHELNRFKEGLLAFVFDTTDRIQHCFWHTLDPQHPVYDPGLAKKYGKVIEDYYLRMDNNLKKVLETIDSNTTLIVCSDHGFTTFRRGVHLNSWLVEKGFMTLREKPGDEEGGPLFSLVDWNKTSAYALGFGGIYLNLKGREGKGIVSPEDSLKLIDNIASKLSDLRDPLRNEPAINRVYNKTKLYQGKYLNNAPDMVVGFRPGFRVSWQTAIGGAPAGIFMDNKKKWSGDHCLDPHFVPGILLMNREVKIKNISLLNIAPTVLKSFGLDGKAMEGAPLI